MRRAITFMGIACSACGAGFAVDPGAADPAVMSDHLPDGTVPSEVLYLPASSTAGVTTRPLLAGVAYRVIIDGTVGLWRAGHWSSRCAGLPLAGPRFPSPGANGPVGADAEWVWAWPTSSPTLCPNDEPIGPPPQPKRRLLVRSSSEATPVNLPPPLETTMTPSHAYSYTVVGMGTPLNVFVDDMPMDDNYGNFRIRVFAP